MYRKIYMFTHVEQGWYGNVSYILNSVCMFETYLIQPVAFLCMKVLEGVWRLVPVESLVMEIQHH